MSNLKVMRLGAIALVTGASAGIGLATAEALAAKGLRVICAARDIASLEEVSSRLEGAHALVLDVTDAKACRDIIENLPEDLREIDILVANAGTDVGGRKRFDEGDVEDWARTVETNVTGMIRTCHAIIPGMLARNRGHVVTLGSTAGLRTYTHGSIYSATKFAVRAFTEGLRADYAGTDLRITEILPGMTRTEFATRRFHGDETRGQEYYESFPASLDAVDIANAILYALDQPPQVTVAQMVVVPTRMP